MKQSLVKKLTAGILTGALAISVTACGGNSADTNNASNKCRRQCRNREQWRCHRDQCSDRRFAKALHFRGGRWKLFGYDIEVLQAVFDRLPQYSLNLQTAEFDAIFSDLPLVIIRLRSIISATMRRERKVTTILSHMMRLNMYLFRGQMMNHSLLYRMPQTEVTRLRQVPE